MISIVSDVVWTIMKNEIATYRYAHMFKNYMQMNELYANE